MKKKQFLSINTSLVTLSLCCGVLGAASAADPPQPRDCVEPPAGLVAWWPLDGNALDRIGSNDGTLVNGPTFTAGLVNQALSFDGNDDAVRIPPSSSLDVGLGDGLTIETWIHPADVSVQRPVVEWVNNDATVSGVHLWISVIGAGSLFGNVMDTTGNAHHIWSAPGLLVPNAWQHIALTYDKVTGVGTLYLNGAVVQQQNLGIFTPQTSLDLLLGHRPSLPSFSGLIDEVSIANRVLSPAEIQGIFDADSAGKCKIPRQFPPTPPRPRHCVESPAGLVAWWPLDGNALDRIGTNDGTLVNGPTFIAGLVDQALSFDGVDDAVRIAPSSSLNVGLSDGLTIETWIHPADVSVQRPVVEWVNNDATVSGVHLWISVIGAGSIFANVMDTTGNAHHISSAPGLVVPDAWQHLALTYDKLTGDAALYLNGTIVQQQNLGLFTPETSLDLLLGHRPSLPSFSGLIDEVSIANRVLSPEEIQGIFDAGSAGKCKRPPPHP